MLGELIPEPKPRSKAWLSTSFPLDCGYAAAAACGPDYHVLTLLQTVSLVQEDSPRFATHSSEHLLLTYGKPITSCI